MTTRPLSKLPRTLPYPESAALASPCPCRLTVRSHHRPPCTQRRAAGTAAATPRERRGTGRPAPARLEFFGEGVERQECRLECGWTKSELGVGGTELKALEAAASPVPPTRSALYDLWAQCGKDSVPCRLAYSPGVVGDEERGASASPPSASTALQPHAPPWRTR